MEAYFAYVTVLLRHYRGLSLKEEKMEEVCALLTLWVIFLLFSVENKSVLNICNRNSYISAML